LYTSARQSAEPTVSIDEIRAARRAIAGRAVETPLIAAEELSRLAGLDVRLKLETVQPTGSFKIRGASNLLSRLSEAERGRPVVCASTGNHGRALAHAARACGMKAIVCLSALVPKVKVEAIKALGAEVRQVGESQDASMAEADRLVREEGCIPAPPFDHPDIIAGQGTIGLEVIEAKPELASVIVPLSGGGLIAGIAVAVKALKPGIEVVGVSMERGAAMQASLAAGRPVEVVEEPTLADSLGGGIGLDNRLTFGLCRRFVDRVALVSEAEIYRGIRHLFLAQGIVAEGAAAVGVAALLAGKLAGTAGPAAVIVSGRNLDPGQFLDIAAGRPVSVGGRMVKA
jgi:threonine dehydratase